MRALIALCLVAGSCSYDFSKLRRPTDGGADVPLSIDGPEAGGDGRDTGGDLDAPARETGSVPTGQGCTAGNQCETGFCSDGICCESACSGVCLTCAGAGR